MPYNQARRGIRGSPQQILFAPPNFVPRKSCFTHNKNKNLAHLKMFSHPNLKNLTTGLRISRRVYSRWCAIIPLALTTCLGIELISLAHRWPRVSGSNWFHWPIVDHVSRDRTHFTGSSLTTCHRIEPILCRCRFWARSTTTKSRPLWSGAKRMSRASTIPTRAATRDHRFALLNLWPAPQANHAPPRRATSFNNQLRKFRWNRKAAGQLGSLTDQGSHFGSFFLHKNNDFKFSIVRWWLQVFKGFFSISYLDWR